MEGTKEKRDKVLKDIEGNEEIKENEEMEEKEEKAIEEEVKLTPEVEQVQAFKIEHIFEFLANLVAALAAVFLIGYLNYLLISNWFIGDFNRDMGSIEISYIQMAKFWVEGGTLWQPQWYFGHPWHVFYTPLLPAIEVLVHFILGFGYAHAYRVITGAGYVLVPVSLYFFVWQISKSKTGALVSALFYSFVPSVIALLFKGVANDVMSGSLEPRRFTILVRWGEGPHTLALVFLPLFGLFVSKYFENSRFLNLFLASVFFVLIALTNAIVVWAAILLLLAMTLDQMTKGIEISDTIRGGLFCLLVSFGLLAFWYNLPFLSTFFREGGGAFSNWQAIFPWGIAVLFGEGVLVFLGVKKFLAKVSGAPFSAFWFLFVFGIVYVYYASGENHLEYAPQALRLNTEADLALSIMAGVLVSFVFLKLGSLVRGSIGNLFKVFALLICTIPVVLLVYLGLGYSRVLPSYTKSLAQGPIGKIENAPEYKVSQKLLKLNGDSQARVLVPGNYGFWLNYFVNLPQLRGALFQSSTHFWPDHIYYQLTNGPDAEISLAWLKIVNVGKLVYTGSQTKELYRDFKVADSKFDQVLKRREENEGDIYYDVPLKNDRIAKIVDTGEILGISKPKNAIDQKPIFAYAAAVEKKADHKLDVSQVNNSKWHISGEIKDGEGILFQETYDSGWKVKSIGVDFAKKRDNFDFIVLVPHKSGSSNGEARKFEADLVYSKPIAVYVGYLITLLTLGFIAKRFLTLILKAKGSAGR